MLTFSLHSGSEFSEAVKESKLADLSAQGLRALSVYLGGFCLFVLFYSFTHSFAYLIARTAS